MSAPAGRSFWRDLSVSAVVAGFVAVLVGFTSSVVIVFQAATHLGATPAQLTSWMWALGLGMGGTSLGLSLWLRRPVLTAWSTPGAAVIAAAPAGLGMNEAVGAFLVCGALIAVAGFSGAFQRVMNRIPVAIASALLAGVLTRFGLDAFGAVREDPVLVVAMLLAYLLGRRLWPRYAVPGVLAVGLMVAAGQGSMPMPALELALARPVGVAPVFSLTALVGLALPLFVVTMASQNLPGVAAIRASGYDTPVSAPIGVTGLATVLLAPFGGYALNLAAITAAICMGREAHEDPARRYTASVVAGALYIIVGLFGGAVVGLLAAFPKPLVVGVAGLALLGTIGAGLQAALRDEGMRESALIAYLVTLSGLTLAGIGAPFWGVVAGLLAWGVTAWRRRI